MNSIDVERGRIRKVVKKTIEKFDLNLEGLNVFTEAATGNYMYTSIAAALAGAEHVFAVTDDSRYGTKEDAKKQTLKEAKELGVDNKITVLFERDRDCLSKSDIITNSGFVRPITKEMIAYMKHTAVIPVMFLTDNLKVRQDIELDACLAKGVLVLGTNEYEPSINLFGSIGFYMCKLLFETSLSVFKNKLLVIASGDMGNYSCDFFKKIGVSFDRVVFDDQVVPDDQRAVIRSREEVLNNLSEYDAIIISERFNNIDILSNDGYIPVGLLKKKNPFVQIIMIAGSVNKTDVVKAGLSIYPEDIKPFGFPTVCCDYLGPNSAIELNVSSLKVGEIMARNRLKYDFERAYKESIKNPLVDDFEGGYLNLRHEKFMKVNQGD
jgi:hypothetical protein